MAPSRWLVAIAGLALASVAAARPGRVVRVVRGHGGSRLPRICQIMPTSGSGTCFGNPPRVGDDVAVVGPQASGTVRIATVTARPDSCENIVRWEVTLDGADRLGDTTMAFGYIDVPIDLARAALLDSSGLASPGGRAGEQVLTALDRDRDARPDFEVVAYACNASGDPVSTQADGYCLDFWTLDRGAWDKAHHDYVRSCT